MEHGCNDDAMISDGDLTGNAYAGNGHHCLINDLCRSMHLEYFEPAFTFNDGNQHTGLSLPIVRSSIETMSSADSFNMIIADHKDCMRNNNAEVDDEDEVSNNGIEDDQSMSEEYCDDISGTCSYKEISNNHKLRSSAIFQHLYYGICTAISHIKELLLPIPSPYR
uniref:Uncharacterized protein n=1 Tax=Romanomermis culicivorax TaxID=13658 RepID=A0A915IRT0_ROMCU